MREYTILVPVVEDSTRLAHSEAAWLALEQELLDLFGGYTRAADRYGVWKDDKGLPVYDTSRVYIVATLGNEENLRDILLLVKWIKHAFDQQCVYVAETSQNVKLI